MSESEDILLAKWLSGEITDAQLKELAQKYDLEELESILKKQELFTPVVKDVEDMWKGIKEKQDQNSTENLEKPKENSRSKNIRRFLLMVLVMVLAKFIYGFLFDGKSSNTIKTLDEPETKVAFADGSYAIAGPQSTLHFNQEQWTELREVSLSGQAFFKVEKGKSFWVKTSAGTVQVLGTEFDVWNIDSDYMTVRCSKGSVRVSDNEGRSKVILSKEEVHIIKGQISEVSRQAGIVKEWRENFRNYKTTPIKILFSDLERFYKVSFATDITIENDVFSGVLPTDDLDKCIRFLETSLLYETDQTENKITFKKAK